jgi:RNA polymerase sigma-70 factor (ECF subfamily)
VVVEQRSQLSLVRPEIVSLVDEDSLRSRTDDDLMLLARGGLSAAFDALIRRHQNTVLSVAARLAGRSSLAPDLAQNTFLAIYRALPKYQARGKFSAYLYRVLLNQCRVGFRSAHVENHALNQFSLLPTDSSEAAEDIILARERQREVESALGCLSPKLRQVVVLRYSGGLSYDEIADVLSAPLGTIKRRLFDAMEKLRVSMEGG